MTRSLWTDLFFYTYQMVHDSPWTVPGTKQSKRHLGTCSKGECYLNYRGITREINAPNKTNDALNGTKYPVGFLTWKHSSRSAKNTSPQHLTLPFHVHLCSSWVIVWENRWVVKCSLTLCDIVMWYALWGRGGGQLWIMLRFKMKKKIRKRTLFAYN